MKGDGLRLGLNCGTTIPCIGFVAYFSPYDKSITHFDMAMVYGSEPAVGRALKEAMREGKVEGEETFVTSKLWGCEFHDPIPSLKQSLQSLEMEYIDIYLMHWPLKLKQGVHTAFPEEDEFEPETDMETTWAGMERCLEIVSNFSSKKIGELVDKHPMRRPRKLGEGCEENNIHVSAYMALGGLGNAWGTTAVVVHPAIKSIDLKHNVIPAQGASVTVKSFDTKRMEENFAALDPKLEDRDASEIVGMEERKVNRAGIYVGRATDPYKRLEDLWDNEI